MSMHSNVLAIGYTTYPSDLPRHVGLNTESSQLVKHIADSLPANVPELPNKLTHIRHPAHSSNGAYMNAFLTKQPIYAYPFRL